MQETKKFLIQEVYNRFFLCGTFSLVDQFIEIDWDQVSPEYLAELLNDDEKFNVDTLPHYPCATPQQIQELYGLADDYELIDPELYELVYSKDLTRLSCRNMNHLILSVRDSQTKRWGLSFSKKRLLTLPTVNGSRGWGKSALPPSHATWTEDYVLRCLGRLVGNDPIINKSTKTGGETNGNVTNRI